MTFTLKSLSATLLLLAGLSPLNAQAVLLPVIADTYLAPAADAAGTSEIIKVNSNNKALLNFALSPLPSGITGANIDKARLVFFVKSVPTSGKLEVSPVTSTWAEGTVNTATAPTVGSSLATSAALSRSDTYYAVDITQLVKNWLDKPASSFGLALQPFRGTSTSVTLDSKEATQTSQAAYIDIDLLGADGPKGDTGAAGTQGAVGPQGLAGDAGVQGDQGADGAQGPQGIQGVQGSAAAWPVGQAPGDIRYWDGAAWVNIAAGLPNATLKFCNHKPTWTTSGCPSPATVYKVGDTGPAGGKVFYLSDATGLHGLEAAPVDQAYAKWGCYGTVVGGTGTAVGKGKANTAAIKAKCGAGTAAQIAASYSLNGFKDWYLPSNDELDLLYAQKVSVSGFANPGYWSSTEYDAELAWYQNFINSYKYYNFKNNTLPVRAVRTF